MKLGINLLANLVGEMDVSTIPVAAGVDVDAIKKGDDDPYEVVVAIPASRSKRGWRYQPEAIMNVVTEVQNATLNGYLGHQKPEDVDSEFKTPVTHWIGATYDETKKIGYFRGVIDKSASDLKRWIRAKRITQVSIFGKPTIKVGTGDPEVVGYKPYSIDWTPLNRAGMPTQIVASGEMVSCYDSLDPDEVLVGEMRELQLTPELAGELDGSFEELKNAIDIAVNTRLVGVAKDAYCYTVKTYDDHVVAYLSKPGGVTYYDIPYTITEGKVSLGDPVEVRKVESYVPVGEMTTNDGGESMTKAEMLAELQRMLSAGEVSLPELTPIVGETAPNGLSLTELGQTLGVTGEMSTDMIITWKETHDRVSAEASAKARGEVVESLIQEKVTGEMAQKFVRDFFEPSGTTTEELSGELATFLAEPRTKDHLQQLTKVTPSVTRRGDGNQTSGGTSRKTRRIGD